MRGSRGVGIGRSVLRRCKFVLLRLLIPCNDHDTIIDSSTVPYVTGYTLCLQHCDQVQYVAIRKRINSIPLSEFQTANGTRKLQAKCIDMSAAFSLQVIKPDVTADVMIAQFPNRGGTSKGRKFLGPISCLPNRLEHSRYSQKATSLGSLVRSRTEDEIQFRADC